PCRSSLFFCLLSGLQPAQNLPAIRFAAKNSQRANHLPRRLPRVQHHGVKPLHRCQRNRQNLTEQHYAFSACPSTLMPVIFTAVYDWRCPCSFLYCFLRFRWNTSILSARSCLTTWPVTNAAAGLAISPSVALTARTSVNSTFSPLDCGSFSISITSPGVTRYCFPPARITAYMAISCTSFRCANATAPHLSGTLTCLCTCTYPAPGRKPSRKQAPRSAGVSCKDTSSTGKPFNTIGFAQSGQLGAAVPMDPQRPENGGTYNIYYNATLKTKLRAKFEELTITSAPICSLHLEDAARSASRRNIVPFSPVRRLTAPGWPAEREFRK